MGALRLKDTMLAIAAALEEAEVVEKAWAWPFEKAAPGDAVVGYPTRIEFSKTFQRGSDEALVPVFIIAGIAGEEATLEVLDRLVGDGNRSVKTVLEAGDHGGLDEVLSYLHVREGAIDGVKLGGVIYAALRMDCEVKS